MESKQSDSSNEIETFRLFDDKPNAGLGFLDFTQKPLQPPPPCLEVFASEVSKNVKYTVEPVNVDGVTLLKGRVSTQEVFALSNADLVPGKYEGGLKLWEGSLDLIKALGSEMQDGKLLFTGKRVLELGCGHGLPGIFACLKGAASVHFQDFNAEVLQFLTIPNVNVNIQKTPTPLNIDVTEKNINVEARFFAGDWSEVHRVLPCVLSNINKVSCYPELDQATGYDIVLMAETVYSISSLPNLYKLIKKCLSNPHGVVYMAAKKYYFGVGGGSRRFLSVVEKDGAFDASLVAEVSDGSSNVREGVEMRPMPMQVLLMHLWLLTFQMVPRMLERRQCTVHYDIVDDGSNRDEVGPLERVFRTRHLEFSLDLRRVPTPKSCCQL